MSTEVKLAFCRECGALPVPGADACWSCGSPFWPRDSKRPSALTQQPRPESFHRVAAKATRDADEVKAGRIRVDLHCTLLRARMSTLEQKHREVASAALACARAIEGEG